MSEKARQLLGYLKDLNKTTPQVLPGTVSEVGESTCTVIVDDLEVFDVQLMATVNEGGKGLIIRPKIGSVVMVQKLSEDREYGVCMYSEIDSVGVTIDQVDYLIDADGYQIKKGSDSLKDVLTMIVEAVLQIVVIQGNNPDYAKLNQALTKIQNLLK